MGSALSSQLDFFYIYLDVDGVLNSAASRGPAKETHNPTAAALGHVAAIAARGASAGLGECRVVLSSTWRLQQSSLKRVSDALASVGLAIYSCTPDLEASCRGDRVDECLLWLRDNANDEVCWVAIDDLDLLAMNGKLKAGHFVRTADATGLSMNEVDEAVAKLRTQHKQLSLQRAGATALRVARAARLASKDPAQPSAAHAARRTRRRPG